MGKEGGPFFEERWEGEIPGCPGFSCQMTVEISKKGERPRISEIAIRSVTPNTTVNAKILRALTREVFKMTEQAIFYVAAINFYEDLGLTPRGSMADSVAEFSSETPNKGGGTRVRVKYTKIEKSIALHSNRKRTDSDWQRIAATYIRAVESGSPVQAAVASVEEVSERHAGNLITDARKLGFLPATTQGKRSDIETLKGESQ